MTYSGYNVKVPGKLVIAGEYAVLEPNQPAVVVAINRYITASIEPSSQNLLSLPQLGFESLTWDTSGNSILLRNPDPRLQFIEQSINVATHFLQEHSTELQPFHLTVTSDLNDSNSGSKYGLGSSAAVVVAVISSILKLHYAQNPSLDLIFKLSSIAHLKVQKNGSGIDIAASTYGGWLMYTSYQREWVVSELQNKTRLLDLIRKPWPNLSITPLCVPTCLTLRVGWTTEVASTGPMIGKVKDFQSKHPEQYTQFLQQSSLAVEKLLKSLEENDCEGALSSLTDNRYGLKELSKNAGIKIETSKLEELVAIGEIYGSCKPSGAGGGDCGIVFMKGEERTEMLFDAWRKKGILPLDVSISEKGVQVIEFNCEPSLEEFLSCC